MPGLTKEELQELIVLCQTGAATVVENLNRQGDLARVAEVSQRANVLLSKLKESTHNDDESIRD